MIKLEPLFNSERISFIPFTQDVYTHAFNSMNQQQVMELFGHQTEAEYLKEKDRFEKGMTTFNRTFLYFQLRNIASNDFLGWCGYHTWYTQHCRAEIFYMLKEEYREKGLMTEALPYVIEYGWNQMELERIEAFVGAFNKPSLALLNKFGFKQEGVFRKHYRVDGVNEDSLAFGLLKEEFTP